MTRKRSPWIVPALLLGLSACDRPPGDQAAGSPFEPSLARIPEAGADQETAVRNMLVMVNEALAAARAPYVAHKAEWLAAPLTHQVGRTVFFKDVGSKRLGSHFVPGDPRRAWSSAPNEITFLVDQSDGATADGLGNTETERAIDRAMATWQNATRCSAFALQKADDDGGDPDLIDALAGFGDQGLGTPRADITHAGWVTAGTFEPQVIAVTFTLVWVDAVGVPTDIDGNGRLDVAFREIYYHDAFDWEIDGNIDVETIALHEAGHGLSQAHFGKAFRTDANGRIHFAPRAVMNAAYSGVQQNLRGTDRGGHCGNWASWGQGHGSNGNAAPRRQASTMKS